MKTSEVYEKVTARLISQMEAGIVPWSKPWIGGEPISVHGYRYRGINALILAFSEYSSNVWLTYQQAKTLGGHVKKGEKGTAVILWKESKRKDLPPGPDGEEQKGVYCTTYTLFNLEQCEGVKLPKRFETKDHKPIDAAEQIAAGYLGNGGPRLSTGGARACYNSETDVVRVPALSTFRSAGEYHSTLFHELTHSTGHASRLGRKLGNLFGSHDYAQEELVAEMGAAFLCARAGLDCGALIKNQAAYLQNWLGVLKSDPKRLVQAASAAQKAADLVAGASAQADESEAA